MWLLLGARMGESFFPLKRLMLGEVIACSQAGVVGRLDECVGCEVCVAVNHQLGYCSTRLLVILAEIMVETTNIRSNG